MSKYMGRVGARACTAANQKDQNGNTYEARFKFIPRPDGHGREPVGF